MAIRPNILIVDDDPAVRKTLSDILRAKDYAPTTAGQGKTALDMVKEQAPDVILIDLKLEDMSGLEVMREIKESSPGTECIVLTGYATQASAIEAVNLGAYGYVQKPCDVEQLLAMIHRAIEKREAEEALRESEHNYRVLFESKIDGMAVIDAETMKVVLANETAAKMYGFDSAEDLIGLNPVKYVHPDDTDRALRTMAEDMFEKDMRQVNEFRTLSKDGREIWVSAVGTRIEYQGRLAGLASFRDITERKRTEGRIQLLTEVLETSPISVIVTDENRKITYVNRVTEELFGYEKGDLLGMDPELLNAEPDADKMQSEIVDAIRQQGIWRGEILNRKKNGDLFYIHASVYWLLDEEGNFIAAAGFQEDVTERKRAEEKLSYERDLMQTLLENHLDFIYFKDSKARFHRVSKRFCDFFGQSREDIIGKTDLELFPEEIAKQTYSEDLHVIETGIPLVNKEESALETWVLTTKIPWFDKEGNTIGLLGISRDITERKRAEEALRESEARYRLLFDSSAAAITYYDTEGKVVLLNAQAAKNLRGEAKDLIGKSIYKLHPEAADFYMEGFTRIMKEGKGVRSEDPVQLPGGKRWFSSDIQPVRDENGNIRGVQIISDDITERKQAEEALRRQEEHFRSLIENASDAIVILNGDGTIRYQSPSYGRVLGYRPEEEIGRDMFDNIHPDDAPNVANEFARLLQHPGLIVTTEVRFQHKDGSWHVMEATANNLLHDPAVEGIVVNFRDITDRKLAQEEVARRNRELAALHHVLMAITQTLDLQEVLDEIASQAGVALGSEYTSIVTVNEDGSLGIDSETFVDIPPLSIRARPDGVTRSIITSGQPVVVNNADAYEGTNPILISAGIKSYAGAPIKTKDVTTGVLFVHSRQPNAFADRLGLLTDLASQAAIAMENARLYKEASTVGALREADRLKTELLANVSHELRTPLASIKGYCTSMLHFYDRLSDEDKRDSLDEINQASDRLTELIENLLQLSRLEATGLHAEKEPTRIEPIISAALEDIQVKAKGYHFVTHVEESLPVLEADPDRIRQVLENLLSNAVKCSPEGTEISVRCEQKGQELVVSVRDQGVGIARKDIDKVFDRFYQVSPGLVQQGSGAGLGLTICKRIVEAHGGRIWAESKPKKGSTFIFTLPLTAEGKFQMLIPKS